MSTTIASLLAYHSTLMNRYGFDSKEMKEFLEKHKDNKELMELCETAKRLKEALMIKPRK